MILSLESECILELALARLNTIVPKLLLIFLKFIHFHSFSLLSSLQVPISSQLPGASDTKYLLFPLCIIEDSSIDTKNNFS